VAKLAAFALVLLAVFALGTTLGNAVGPIDVQPAEHEMPAEHEAPGPHEPADDGETSDPASPTTSTTHALGHEEPLR
jgi:hypothetical protein